MFEAYLGATAVVALCAVILCAVMILAALDEYDDYERKKCARWGVIWLAVVLLSWAWPVMLVAIVLYGVWKLFQMADLKNLRKEDV